jgi:hypothetical protein
MLYESINETIERFMEHVKKGKQNEESVLLAVGFILGEDVVVVLQLLLQF